MLLRSATSAALVLLLSLLVVPAAGAATPPTIPFDSTGDLFLADNGCDCLVTVAEDGTVTVAVTEAEIAATDTAAVDADDVNMNETGVAVAADGTVYFVNEGTDSVLALAPDGTLSLVFTEDDLEADVLTETNIEKMAFGPDGTLYLADNSGDRLLTYDLTTGTGSVYKTSAELSAPADIPGVDLEGGIAVDASGAVYLGNESSPDTVIKVAPDGTVSALATAAHEVQTVSTDATGGTFTLDLDAETTGPISFDATSAAVEAALEALGAVDDVAVAGAGTAADPWVVTFLGSLSGTDVSTLVADSSGLSGGTATTDTSVDGGDFSDFDVFATLDGDGAFIIADDSGSDTIWRITADGTLSVYLRADQVAAVTGSDPDYEGGIAFDEDGRLLMADDENDQLLRYDGSTVEIYVDSPVFLAATTSSPAFDGGIAFRMPIVDLSPAITAPAEAVAGAVFSYTVTVTNDGPNAVDAFALTTTGLDGATVTGDTTDLAAGDSVDLTVEGTVPSDATGSLSLSVTTAPALGAVDTDATNDTDATDVPITTSADLKVGSAAPESLAVDGTADIVVTVTNDGPSDAVDVVVTDTLPAGTVLEVVDAGDFDCTEDGGVVTCTIASFAAGTTATITLTVTTDELDCTAAGEDAPVECSFDGAVLSSLLNTVSVSAATDDPVDDNNAATATMVLDTSDVEVDLPAAGASTNGLATSGLLSILLGAVLLHLGHRRPRVAAVV